MPLAGAACRGKVANLIVVNGDAREIRTEVEHVFVDGVPVSLDNRHQSLCEKYRSRPQPER
ncbi:MAG: hypothetical protein F4Y71_05790 [Acidobacteria bacterium]|nr:hypothetical protein [Acidobacteriota bacterium]MYG75181.1 hypothetical protein [Acidobacteriota bacterium]